MKPKTSHETRYQVRTNFDTAIIGFEYPADEDTPLPRHDGKPECERKQIAPNCFAIIGIEGIHFGREAYPAAPLPYEWHQRDSAARVAKKVGGYVEERRT